MPLVFATRGFVLAVKHLMEAGDVAYPLDALKSGQLIQPFEEFRDNDSGYWLVYPKTRRNSGKIRLFRKWLEAEFADVRMQKSQSTVSSQILNKPDQPSK